VNERVKKESKERGRIKERSKIVKKRDKRVKKKVIKE
jgi:hypothetical protein